MRQLLTASLIIILTLSSCARLFRHESKIELAEALLSQSRFDEAIAAYKDHMQERLDLEKRPDWENPWFYCLMIGDVELQAGRPEKASEYYHEAESKGVETVLVLDRFRNLASWYESRDRLKEAEALLKTRAAKDPLLFNAMLDRISREIVRREDN